MKISAINIYPIKSLGGISLDRANLTPKGLEHDRRFMLTNKVGKFLTQRSNATMALLKTKIEGDQLIVWDSRVPADQITFLLNPTQFSKQQLVEIWADTCMGNVLEEKINEWFSQRLGQDCQVVYMPDNTHRLIEEAYRKEGEVVSFADGYPILLLGDASMNDLNARLAEPVPADRFRANILFSGGTAFEEDEWNDFSINTQLFRGVKPCSRCQVPNINQQTGEMGREPNSTLAKYRRIDRKIKMGLNVCWRKDISQEKASIAVGDTIKKGI